MNQNVNQSTQADESSVSKISAEIETYVREQIEERDTIKGYIKNIADGYGNDNGTSIASYGAKVSVIEGKIEAIRQIQSIINREVKA